MKLMLQYMAPYKGKITYTIFLKFVGVILELLNPYFLEYMIDVAAPAGDIPLVFGYGGAMVLCTVAGFLSNVIANRMATATARNAIREVRDDLFKKTMYLNGKDYDIISLPSLISRMTSDSYNVQTFLGMIQRMGVRAPMMLVGGITVAALMDPVLTLVLIGMIPVMALSFVLINKLGIPLFKKVQERMDTVVKVMRENISGIRVIKALSMIEYEKERFSKANNELTEDDIKAGRIMAVPNPVMHLALNIGITCVILVGAVRVNNGVMKVGVILAFLTYFNIIMFAVMGMNRIFIQYSKAAASADRISEVLKVENSFENVSGKEDNGKADISKAANHDNQITDNKNEKSNNKYDAANPLITFENVGIKEMGLSDISFTLEKGKTLGIIGATGCGKTTILNLLMRFYDVDQGRVLYKGVNVKDMSLKELRSHFGVVFQNDTIFSDTLYENIRFSRDINEEDIRKAAHDAGIGGYIESLPDKYNHVAAIRGMNLSGGQRQRILIARALAGKPDVIVLDDASSALDYKTDASIRGKLLSEYDGIAKIMIAQRVSSVMNMDKIIVLDEGKIIGMGNHQSLMQECQIYKEIYRLQMGEV